MKDANFLSTARLMEAIRDYESEHLTPHGISLQFAGDVAVSQTLIQAIVSTQVRSLLGSLVGIFVVASLLGRSIRWGLFCVLPCALAVLINFAVMGWADVPLGVATSMFAGMTLGIGVDYAVHLMERYRYAQGRVRACAPDVACPPDGAQARTLPTSQEGPCDPTQRSEAAIADAVAETGPAILIDAIAVALGFGVLVLSQVPANARLGGLVVLSIVGCLAATLTLLPALLRVWPPHQVRRPEDT